MQKDAKIITKKKTKKYDMAVQSLQHQKTNRLRGLFQIYLGKPFLPYHPAYFLKQENFEKS